MSTATEYLLHGLAVRSEVPLLDARPLTTSREEPLDIVLAPGAPVPREVPEGVVLAAEQHEQRPDELFYVLVDRGDDDLLLRVWGIADVSLGRTSTIVTVTPDPRADHALLSVLVSGLVLGSVLLLRGRTVLHASAVEWHGRAIAFTGYSGMGKSTLASLACTAGARFLTDDVLRLDAGPGGLPLARLGGVEARLRQQAAALAVDGRLTVDGRLAASPPLSDQDRLPLAAVLVPMPSHGDPDAPVSVRWMTPKEAVMMLAALPRVSGWTDPQSSRQLFDGLCDLVLQVPVGVITVPWGPPFAPGVADKVVQAALEGRSV